MFTRKQRLEEKCTHEEYYNQFLDASVMNRVLDTIGKKAILNSTDSAFNDISLSKWDRVYCLCPAHIAKKFRDAGDSVTLAGLVCLAKAAARVIKSDG